MEIYVGPVKTFVSADVTFNLINLVSQHQALYDKHQDYLSNKAVENIWF